MAAVQHVGHADPSSAKSQGGAVVERRVLQLRPRNCNLLLRRNVLLERLPEKKQNKSSGHRRRQAPPTSRGRLQESRGPFRKSNVLSEER